MYNSDNKNYARESDAGVIMNLLTGIAEKRPEIKNVVIDTLSSIMSDKEMSERKQKGYDERTCRSKTYLIAGISQEPKFERTRTNGQSAAKTGNSKVQRLSHLGVLPLLLVAGKGRYNLTKGYIFRIFV